MEVKQHSFTDVRLTRSLPDLALSLFHHFTGQSRCAFLLKDYVLWSLSDERKEIFHLKL